jgi:AGCS family alanine or glycine:cation symporter
VANPNDLQVPLVVAWLVVGALFLTLRMGFINLRAFGHAIMVTTGKYDDPDDPGEISHFKALSSALSATVGLGNIAGVAIAVAVGGPGAIPWMIIAGFLGMSSKFTECTLGQLYRDTDSKGQVLGGPMKYLDRGLAEKGLGPLGKVLAVVFSLMCIGGSLGGGNMFQANQSYAAVAELVPMLADNDWLYGVILVVFVGAVILGGIKRIGAAAGLIVPVMCGVYVMAALYIILSSPDQIGPAFGTMFEGAFSTEAGIGGVLGALIQGFRRAAFSNEAGVGSASIAHSAAATDEPVREGIVALLEPFIDTIVVCTMTGLVVVITGAYLQDTGDGVLMTSAAFGSVISWFPMVLTFAVVMFAFSTMISWSYYGERCATWLFGAGASLPYKVLFLVCTFLGVVFELGTVLDFSDLMILGMAFPNILGLFILSGLVKEKLDDYWGRLKSGEMLPDR